jgi:uncharacterized protein
MKYVIIIVIVLALVWLARSRRPTVRGDDEAVKKRAPPAIEDMVTCTHCNLHLPKSDALPGRGGYFCGEAHRAAHERSEAPR